MSWNKLRKRSVNFFKPYNKLNKYRCTNDRTTEADCIVVGEGVTVTGEFSVPGRAVVNGSITGDLQADELLVGETGKVVGSVRVRKADIHGETHEKLLASEILVIRATGRVNGDISFGGIEIERGGSVNGTLSPTKSDPLPTPAAKPVGPIAIDGTVVS
jgi:cytoskeletal protein CcmA (bactofilin family)